MGRTWGFREGSLTGGSPGLSEMQRIREEGEMGMGANGDGDLGAGRTKQFGRRVKVENWKLGPQVASQHSDVQVSLPVRGQGKEGGTAPYLVPSPEIPPSVLKSLFWCGWHCFQWMWVEAGGKTTRRWAPAPGSPIWGHRHTYLESLTRTLSLVLRRAQAAGQGN